MESGKRNQLNDLIVQQKAKQAATEHAAHEEIAVEEQRQAELEKQFEDLNALGLEIYDVLKQHHVPYEIKAVTTGLFSIEKTVIRGWKAAERILPDDGQMAFYGGHPEGDSLGYGFMLGEDGYLYRYFAIPNNGVIRFHKVLNNTPRRMSVSDLGGSPEISQMTVSQAELKIGFAELLLRSGVEKIS